jgi:hypothetical protein
MQDEWSYADRLLGKLLNIFILYEFNVLQFRLNETTLYCTPLKFAFSCTRMLLVSLSDYANQSTERIWIPMSNYC